MMKFENLNIIQPILKAVSEKGYETPTPIQVQAIPLILERNDILGCAQTGTGKTAAFAIPILQLIQKIDGNHTGRPKLRSLIITPTRELAIQIDDNVKSYNKHLNLKHTVIFGGVKQGKQVEKLKQGVHILVATPGRLLDLINQGYISLNDIKLFVLDEADRMLDMGFINDIRKILKLLPLERQSLFFSATMPDNIVSLSNTILTKPKKIEVAVVSSAAKTIKQYLYYTNKNTKNDLLLHILKDKEIEQVLVFTRTKHGADKVVRNLKKNNINAAAIHGNKAQNQRQKALQQFKSGGLRVLVATDIAARGIDINELIYVINYEVPNLPETYVHRIGRSGRAGKSGISISISEPEENAYIRDIQKLLGKKIELIKDNPYPQTEKPMTSDEKKEWNKEKIRRKQEFFTNKNKSRNNKSESRPNPSNKSTSKSGTDAKAPVKKKRRPNKSQGQQQPQQQKDKRKKKGEMPKSLKNKMRWPLG